MHPQYEPDKKPAGKCYTDVEGGLGWWRDTHFPTTTPKFIMGGVGPNFRWIANGPGYGAGTWEPALFTIPWKPSVTIVRRSLQYAGSSRQYPRRKGDM
jgi:hypothetical protein